MSVFHVLTWALLMPAVGVCTFVACTWGLMTFGEWRRRVRAAERYRLDRRLSERLKAEWRRSVAPREGER